MQRLDFTAICHLVQKADKVTPIGYDANSPTRIGSYVTVQTGLRSVSVFYGLMRESPDRRWYFGAEVTNGTQVTIPYEVRMPEAVNEMAGILSEVDIHRATGVLNYLFEKAAEYTTELRADRGLPPDQALADHFDALARQFDSPDTPPDDERLEVLSAMMSYGGGFIKLLASAWLHADEHNSAILYRAFRRDYDRYKAEYVDR